jgi:hypothetical protein
VDLCSGKVCEGLKVSIRPTSSDWAPTTWIGLMEENVGLLSRLGVLHRIVVNHSTPNGEHQDISSSPHALVILIRVCVLIL